MVFHRFLLYLNPLLLLTPFNLEMQDRKKEIEKERQNTSEKLEEAEQEYTDEAKNISKFISYLLFNSPMQKFLKIFAEK